MKQILLLLITLFIWFSPTNSIAQNFTQIVKGILQNEETKMPLIDIEVLITSGDFSEKTKSNSEGEFLFKEVPVGRAKVTVNNTRFEAFEKTDILVTSAKEVRLNITLESIHQTLKEVNVSATTIRDEPLNRMATVSSHVLNIEETQKFAGSWDDPTRLATSFAGVTQLNSAFNSFSVRGNAPVGMLYRLEGVPIHNPNHFAAIGSTGGFITQFSTQLLTTSEFFSGAFPAEFGNATTAVFDFKFRNGNKDKHEYSAGINVFGVDFTLEGPFKKNSKASYLINYRYSSFGLFARAFKFGNIVPGYQDLSFNLTFPTKKIGTFKVFGIGGLSDLAISAEEDSTEWDNKNRSRRNLGSNSGAIGLVHYLRTSDKGYWHSVLAGSVGKYYDNADYLKNDLSYDPREIGEYVDSRITYSTDYNHRFGNRHSNKTGLVITHINHSFSSASYNKAIDALDTFAITNGAAQTIQAFSQSKFSLTEKLGLNAGVHFLYFALNGKTSLEPRLGLSYKLGKKSLVALGYGLHGRVEDLSIYFYEEKNTDGQILKPNMDLGLLRSHQGVIRFAHMFSSNLKWTVETYIQYFKNVPVDPTGAFSVQNLLWQFPTKKLDNIGEGRNYGVEMSLQRFTKKGFYFLVSGAVFTSEYKGGDGIWRNTEFNQSFSYNILGGKEFELEPKKKKNKKRLLGLNFNIRHSGGTWQTPIDETQSALYGWTQYDYNNPYSDRQKDLMNLDFTLSLKGIKKNITSEFSIQIKNLLNNKTVLRREWDERIGGVKEITDYGIIPVIGYKIWF